METKLLAQKSGKRILGEIQNVNEANFASKVSVSFVCVSFITEYWIAYNTSTLSQISANPKEVEF